MIHKELSTEPYRADWLKTTNMIGMGRADWFWWRVSIRYKTGMEVTFENGAN
jgi:hypothetical protein